MLTANVNLSRRRSCRAGDRLLQYLRRSIRGRAMILVLLEDLITRSRVDGDRHGGGDGDSR